MGILKKTAACLAITFVGGLAQAAEAPQVVEKVDLNRYLGDWYEIASIPQWFQRNCVGNVKATYTLSGEKNNAIKVVNSCQTENGLNVAEGRARIVDPVSNAKLAVTFAQIAGYWIFAAAGDYWIIDLAPDYSFAVVSNSSRSTAWILSRTKTMAPEVLMSLEAKLRAQGFDSCKLMTTIQDGGLQERAELCKVVR